MASNSLTPYGSLRSTAPAPWYAAALSALVLLTASCRPDAISPTTPMAPPDGVVRSQQACTKNGEVLNGAVTCVEITGTVVINPGQSTTLTCDGYDAFGYRAPDNVTRTWTFSGDTRVAQITSTTTTKTITVVANGPGSVSVDCTFPNAAWPDAGPVGSSVGIDVTGTRTIASVALAPSSMTLKVGQEYPVTVTYTDQYGHTNMVSPATTSWYQSAQAIAYLTPDRKVRAVYPGTATFRLTADGITSNTLTVTVIASFSTLDANHIDTDLDWPQSAVPIAKDAAGNRVYDVGYSGTVANPQIATIDCTVSLNWCTVTPRATGTTTYTVSAQGISVTRNVTVRPAPAPLTVLIGGPRSVRAGQTCLWSASVSGGRPPYTYAWWANGTWQGNATSMTWTVNTSVSPVYVQSQVTDALGRVVNASLTVTVSPTAKVCQF